MIDEFKKIETRDDFLSIRPFDIQSFLTSYFLKADYVGNIKDHFSKLNDCLFPVSDNLGVRAITNIDSPYLITKDTDFVLIEGHCTLEILTYSEQQCTFDWLSTVHIDSTDLNVFNSGNKIEIKCRENEFYLLKPKTRCLLVHWKYQEKGSSNIIGKYKSSVFNLTDQGRKLIKLSKNIYVNQTTENDHELRSDFYNILSKINEKDLFYIHATKSYLIFKKQIIDFDNYVNSEYPHL